jgi:hypothetical protein
VCEPHILSPQEPILLARLDNISGETVKVLVCSREWSREWSLHLSRARLEIVSEARQEIEARLKIVCRDRERRVDHVCSEALSLYLIRTEQIGCPFSVECRSPEILFGPKEYQTNQCVVFGPKKKY